VLVGRVVESVRQPAPRAVELDVDDDLPDVIADPDKFTQVVTNLVENAVRHGDGTVTVRLQELPAWATSRASSSPWTTRATGIPDTIRQRVFTKFWKHGERGGSGLGMYLVNGLVRAHGGQVEIEDAPGGGARIVVLGRRIATSRRA
jgi:signal transduction histidine kinase